MACWEVGGHAADSIQGALEVGGPFQEEPEAWVSEALLDACSQGGNGGDLQQLVPLHLEASPLWASLEASTREEELVGKREAYQAFPSQRRVSSGQALGLRAAVERLRKAGGADLPGTEGFVQPGAVPLLNHDVPLWNLS